MFRRTSMWKSPGPAMNGITSQPARRNALAKNARPRARGREVRTPREELPSPLDPRLADGAHRRYQDRDQPLALHGCALFGKRSGPYDPRCAYARNRAAAATTTASGSPPGARTT
jgi:hypothetical protein